MPFRRRYLGPIAAASMLAAAVAVSPAHAATTSATTSAPTRFTVVDEGAAGKPDILLIPGLASSRKVWATEAAKLAPDYRLHLVQLNGFAGQPAGANAVPGALLPAIVEELHAYIAANGLHPVVVGHSLGGLLALMLAEKYPGDVARLAIVDALPFVGLMFGPQATVAAVQPMAQTMRDGMLTQAPARRLAMEQRTAETLALDPAGRAVVVADGLASDPQIAARAMYEDFQTDVRPTLADIRAPTLVLYAFDPTLVFPNGMKPTQAMADAIATDAYKTMPNARLVRVDGSRHFIMFDQPARLHDTLGAFLTQPAG